MDPSPALVLRFPDDTTPARRDRLVALLADHSLIAIHEDDPAAPRTWVAHFADTADRDAAREALLGLLDAADIDLQSTEIADEDWARRTQADLPAVTVGNVIVAPPWDLPAQSDLGARILVVIEPSRGFGTGHHQSTRLCLRLLQDLVLAGTSMVDVGTGSGVLAIAAAKLGAARIVAIDEDPEAIENARENIARNDVSGRVHARVEDAFSSSSSVPPAAIVTANLTGTLLARQAANVGRFVETGGRLVVSGFTVDERPMVIEAFMPAFAVDRCADEDDWWALVLRRRAPGS